MEPIPDEELILMQFPTGEKPRLLLLTYQQFQEGYSEKIGDEIHSRSFRLIHDYGDGTCVVEDPRSKEMQ